MDALTTSVLENGEAGDVSDKYDNRVELERDAFRFASDSLVCPPVFFLSAEVCMNGFHAKIV